MLKKGKKDIYFDVTDFYYGAEVSITRDVSDFAEQKKKTFTTNPTPNGLTRIKFKTKRKNLIPTDYQYNREIQINKNYKKILQE